MGWGGLGVRHSTGHHLCLTDNFVVVLPFHGTDYVNQEHSNIPL